MATSSAVTKLADAEDLELALVLDVAGGCVRGVFAPGCAGGASSSSSNFIQSSMMLPRDPLAGSVAHFAAGFGFGLAAANRPANVSGSKLSSSLITVIVLSLCSWNCNFLMAKRLTTGDLRSPMSHRTYRASWSWS